MQKKWNRFILSEIHGAVLILFLGVLLLALSYFFPFVYWNQDWIIRDWLRQLNENSSLFLISLLLFPYLLVALTPILSVLFLKSKESKTTRIQKTLFFLEKYLSLTLSYLSLGTVFYLYLAHYFSPLESLKVQGIGFVFIFFLLSFFFLFRRRERQSYRLNGVKGLQFRLLYFAWNLSVLSLFHWLLLFMILLRQHSQKSSFLIGGYEAFLGIVALTLGFWLVDISLKKQEPFRPRF